VDYPLLSDPDTKVAESYGVRIFIIGLAKRWTFYIGKDGKILFIDRDVKPDTAGDDVAAKLLELGIPKRK
jgi:thioredoxin-dependent peroxiredoxin